MWSVMIAALTFREVRCSKQCQADMDCGCSASCHHALDNWQLGALLHTLPSSLCFLPAGRYETILACLLHPWPAIFI